MSEQLLTERDLAERWQCSPGSLANQRSEGSGPRFVKLGKLVRYRLADIEAYEVERVMTETVAA